MSAARGSSRRRPAPRRRPARRRRPASPLVPIGVLLLAAALVFLLGVGLGQALRDGADVGGERTVERTLDPESLPPPPETVTVTVTVASP